MSFSESFLQNDLSAPANDEFELSVFGAGLGESILIHLGNGSWITIDSLKYKPTKRPVALEYLEAIGVDPATALKRVVISHWHDDHTDGVTEVASKATSASIVVSQCLSANEFVQVVEVQKTHKSALKRTTTGVDELGEVFGIAKGRTQSGQANAFMWAGVNRELFTETRDGVASSIRALSPADGDFTRSLEAFQKLLPQLREEKRRIPNIMPNNTAVVLWVRFNNFTVLLGSDLEEASAIDRGWKAICRLDPKPEGKAHAFKVAHHGSENAHSEESWEVLIENNPFAVLTPYTPSKLPRDSDIDRILSKTTNAYSAAKRTPQKTVARDAAVERTLREGGHKLRPLEGNIGLVRYRLRGTTSSQKLFGSATELKNLKGS